MPTRKQSFRVLFYIRNQRENKEGSPIMMRITVNGVQARQSVGRRVPKSYWDKKRGEVKLSFNQAQSINLHLEKLRSQAYIVYSRLERFEEHFSAQCLLDHMQGKSDGKLQTVLEYWEIQNDEIKRLIGKTSSHANWRKHNTARRHFGNFLMLKYGTADLPIYKLSRTHLDGFYSYMIEKLGHCHNTAIKNLQFMKKIVCNVFEQGGLSKNPFNGFSMSLQPLERPFLNQLELDRLLAKQFSLPRLELVKDLFLFSCYTGLAYIDVYNLRKEELLCSPDGVWWIKTLREKTNVRSQIPLLQIPLDIIVKYADLESLSASAKLFAIPSNQKTNSYLKEIADLCGIEKNLTFHMARHTFATTVTLQNGIPIESVSKMLGHTNIVTTQHYAKVLDAKISQDMLLMSQKLNLKMGGA
jgi:integrase